MEKQQDRGQPVETVSKVPERQRLKGELEVIESKAAFLRDGTATHKREHLFQLHNGGMGDYINWMAAIKWVAKEFDYVVGRVVAPAWFCSVVKNVLKDFPEWEVYPDIVPEKYREGFPIKRAPIHPVNATMMHLLDLGFLYYAGTSPVPQDAGVYPQLDLSEIKLPKILQDKKYVVVTAGATATTRAMSAEAVNSLTAHIIEKGMTPVFLGRDTMEHGKRKIHFNPQYDLSVGVDLINQTTVMQAARIMNDSECVVGIDNGLLHLAGMTKASIVFGYTIAGPMHRRPLREKGHIVELYNEPSELKCTFCQEKLRFFHDHDFEFCVYKDYLCTKRLNGKSFCHALDTALEQRKADATIPES